MLKKNGKLIEFMLKHCLVAVHALAANNNKAGMSRSLPFTILIVVSHYIFVFKILLSFCLTVILETLISFIFDASF